MSRRGRFVVDTNVLISSVIVDGGKAQQSLLKAADNGHYLISMETFAELREVLYRKRFNRFINNRGREQFLQDYLAKCVIVPVTDDLKACSDPKDDMFVDLAVSGKADFVITGNLKDFPRSPFKGVQIMSPAGFLEHSLVE
ncbi:putative toxin-antitoxin system toxin component, PIN family [Rhodothermus sp. AH-315-K08]|nr:putative toxin-antitoxin system toxin component, PIN family [Rhodothermus sp. AH-315-K08]